MAELIAVAAASVATGLLQFGAYASLRRRRSIPVSFGLATVGVTTALVGARILYQGRGWFTFGDSGRVFSIEGAFPYRAAFELQIEASIVATCVLAFHAVIQAMRKE